MSWFACTHPARALIVLTEQTVQVTDRDFERVTYHLRCIKCLAPVSIAHMRTWHGVAAFLAEKLDPEPTRS